MKAAPLLLTLFLVQPLLAQTGNPHCGVPNLPPDPQPSRCASQSDSESGGDSTGGPNPGVPSTGHYSHQVDLSSGPIRPNSGGARLLAHDVTVPGALGDLPMGIERHYQSRDTTANADLMGHGRTWSHTYSWRMWASGSGGTNRSILFPGGYVLDFLPHPGTIDFEGQTSVKYIPQAGFGERLFKVGDMWYLLIPGGERFAFERVTDPDTTVRYVPRSARDTKGNLHYFTTDERSRITRVEDAAGNWLELAYSGVPLERRANVNIHTLSSAPVVGWNEVTVSTTQPFRWLQGISAPDNNFRVAEIEFHKPVSGGTQKLNGTAYGTDPDFGNGSNRYHKAFDGSTSTGFGFSRPNGGVAGIDLGAGNESHVTKIRFFIHSANAGRLNSYIGLQFVGCVDAPEIITVLTQVTTSAGQTVNYHYGSHLDASIGQTYLVLAGIDYLAPGGAVAEQAEIQWVTAQQGSSPCVKRVIEPRAASPIEKDIAFDYHPSNIAVKGQPSLVKNGSSGETITTSMPAMTLSTTAANGGVHQLVNTNTTAFLPSSSTDAAGMATSYIWDASRFLTSRTTPAGTTSYLFNYMGQLLTTTRPDGLVKTNTFDVQGRILSATLAAPGHPSRTTTYTRNASGRVTRITYPDTSFEDYTYNTLGLLTSVRGKNGSFTVHTYDTTVGSPTAGLRLATTRGLPAASSPPALGETTSFTYHLPGNASGSPARRLASVTDPRGRTTAYEYDSAGRVTKTTYPDNSFRQIAFDSLGNKTTEFDGSSLEQWTYDSFQRMLTHTDALGGVTTYDYGPNGTTCTCYSSGAPTLITSPAGRKTRRTYDLKGRLLTETRGFTTTDAATTTRVYDTLGRTTKIIDPDGHQTTYTHAPAGRVLTQTADPAGLNLATIRTYSPFGDTLTVKLPGNRTTTTVYDKMSRPVSIKDPLLRETVIGYDLAGNRTAVTEIPVSGAPGTAATRTTGFTYDAYDRLITTTFPGGATATQTYHPGGDPDTTTDEMGRQISRDTVLETWQDSLGQNWTSFASVTVQDPAGLAHTSKSYGPPMSFTGGTRRSVSPMGRVSESYSDELGRTTLTRTGLVTPASSLTADVTDTVMTYDADGFTLTSTVDPTGLNETTTYTPDGLARVKSVTDPLRTTAYPNGRKTEFFYEKRGNRVKTKLHDGREHLAAYDSLGRLDSTTDAKLQVIRYTYWYETGQTLTLKDAKLQTTTWSYNQLGQLLTKLYPNGDDHAYEYDGHHRMHKHTTPKNEVCTYSYDVRDRQTLADWNTTTPDTARTYWANGLLKSIDNGVSKSDYAYSVKNELTSETQTLAGQTAKVVSHTYDADGLRLQMNSPSGSPVDYEWTAKAQLDVISRDGPPPLASYDYDKAGRLDILTHENGIVQDLTYDAASQLQSRVHKQGGTTTVSGHGYGYDATGRRTAETFPGTSTPARTYGYDTADQVTSANYDGGGTQTDAYAYDPAGNRSTATVIALGGTATTYTANSVNQYTSITGISAPVHDANGNLTSQNGVTYTWDSENRLLSVSDGTTINTFTYDALHRRVTKRTAVSGTVTNKVHYLYDGWNVIEERTNTDTTPGFALGTFALTKTLTWGTDLSGSLQGAGGVGGLLMVEEIGTTTTAYHFQYDGNGNVTEITDHTGASAATYRYDAFGNTLVATGSYAATNRYRFSTKPLDDEIANALLYYYGYRYYDPTTGRWPSRDPIEEAGGLNLYGFVWNDGVNQWDVLGLEVISIRNEGSGKNKADQNTVPSGITEYLQNNYGEDNDIEIHIYAGSEKAHTKNDISTLAKKLADEKGYEKVFIFVSGHGQIVGEDYSINDVVTAEERATKGAYIAMDSDVLTIPLISELKRLDPKRVIPEISACFNIPYYRHKKTGSLIPTNGWGHRPDYLDYSETFYRTSGYGDLTRFKQALDHFIEKKGSCKYAVAIFTGRYANATAANEGFE